MPGESESRRAMKELEDARNLMLVAAAVFERWEQRLLDVVQELPDPQFELGTDDPMNLPAAIQGLLEGVLHDEIQQIMLTLRRAAAWEQDPATWQVPLFSADVSGSSED